MRLAIDLPADWHRTRDGDALVATRDDLRLRIEHHPMPSEPLVAARRMLLADLSAGAAPTGATATEHATVEGWPVALLGAELPTERGAVGRAIAMVRLLDVLVLARLDGPAAAVTAARTALLDQVCAARADWGHEPVAISQLWPGPTA